MMQDAAGLPRDCALDLPQCGALFCSTPLLILLLNFNRHSLGACTGSTYPRHGSGADPAGLHLWVLRRHRRFDNNSSPLLRTKPRWHIHAKYFESFGSVSIQTCVSIPGPAVLFPKGFALILGFPSKSRYLSGVMARRWSPPCPLINNTYRLLSVWNLERVCSRQLQAIECLVRGPSFLHGVGLRRVQ